MFYLEEDVTPTVNIAVELFGPVGTMIEGKGVIRNVIVGSKQYGKLWYGDIQGNKEYLDSLCSILSQRTGQAAMIVTENF